MDFDYYRLSSGLVVPADATATKGAPWIDFELKADPITRQRRFTVAVRVEKHPGCIVPDGGCQDASAYLDRGTCCVCGLPVEPKAKQAARK